jgi:isocitrate/isopropylmalate dehydrogenase
MITTPAQFFFQPSHSFAVVEQPNRFDVDVVEKPFFMLLSELSSFIRNHLHLKAPAALPP